MFPGIAQEAFGNVLLNNFHQFISGPDWLVLSAADDSAGNCRAEVLLTEFSKRLLQLFFTEIF